MNSIFTPSSSSPLMVTSNYRDVMVQVIQGSFETFWCYLFAELGDQVCNQEENAVSTNVDSDWANVVYRSQYTEDNAEQKVTAIMQNFNQKNKKMMWYIGPFSSPPSLAKTLEDFGLRKTDEETGMAIDLENVFHETVIPPQGVQVIQVQTSEQFDAWVAIQSKVMQVPHETLKSAFHSYLDPNLILFLAYLNGNVVATAIICITIHSTPSGFLKVAGLHCVDVLPEVRRMGIGRYITISSLTEAKKLECKVGVLFATKQGYPLYLKLGFKEYMKCDSYTRS